MMILMMTRGQHELVHKLHVMKILLRMILMIASTMLLNGNKEIMMMMFVMMFVMVFVMMFVMMFAMMSTHTGASMNLCTRAALLTLTSFTLQVYN